MLIKKYQHPKNAAQHSVQWTLGILRGFQAFSTPQQFSVWTAFRPPPQRH
jgi:hypothetical protein